MSFRFACLSWYPEQVACLNARELLAAHGIDEETSVEVAFSGTTLIVTASIDAERKARFERALSVTNERFGAALERLAE